MVDLDDRCGDHFAYRDLIECGETWHRLAATDKRIDNIPQASATFRAMRDLCERVLDPVTRQFGPIELTYGFASAPLAAVIKRRIAPRLDQHAGHEVTRAGLLVCPRLGLACDFLVRGHDSRDIAIWVARTTAFDRLYFYGPDRPIHVSVGPEEKRQVVRFAVAANGSRVPRVILGHDL